MIKAVHRLRIHTWCIRNKSGLCEIYLYHQCHFSRKVFQGSLQDHKVYKTLQNSFQSLPFHCNERDKPLSTPFTGFQSPCRVSKSNCLYQAKKIVQVSDVPRNRLNAKGAAVIACHAKRNFITSMSCLIYNTTYLDCVCVMV